MPMSQMMISQSHARSDALLTGEWRRRPDVRHLYIHIPFCHRRCAYCDFNTYANMEDRMEAYVAALCAELRSFAHLNCAVPPAVPMAADLTRAMLRPTIFLGGGTPSMLPEALMEQTLAAADTVVPLRNAEVTVECNPGTVLGREYLRALREMGVNRVSLGVQSLHDPTLRMLGRIHTAAEAYASFNDARAIGFESINLDLIFGLPGQTVGQWEETLREIVTWGADHVALYSLILEERTPLYAQVTSGRIRVPDDDATGAMYELAIEHFAAAGYVQYEISNWARSDDSAAPAPRHACHHNLAYWLNADYLAAGAGAHGHLYPRRYVDVAGIDDYIARVRAGALPIADVIELTPRDLAAETMFMGLRLNVGISRAHFRDRCGVDIDAIFGAELAELAELELIERDEHSVRLTHRGRMLGNRVFERFV